MRKLYRFEWDCGRMGNIGGVFIAEESEVDSLFGKEIYFGEVLGKHSEICGILEQDDIELLSDDQEFISKLYVVLGSDTICGYNPLMYYEDIEDEVA